MKRHGWYGRLVLIGISLAMSACASVNDPAMPGSEGQTIFPQQAMFSSNVAVFGRWTQVADRFAQQKEAGSPSADKWAALVDDLKSRPLADRVARANSYFNAVPYVLAVKNWGDAGYWETPYEFLARGGQCQDYAIAKYFALKASGVPESDMRFVVVRDIQRSLDHAILIVAVNGQDYVLDNQDTRLETLADVHRYRAYYALNNTGWWAYSVRVASTQVATSGIIRPEAQ
jgi:predicted transglutaminase-like cysteine proteinase